MIIIGATYRFNYPAAFVSLPEYTAHAGQAVKVLCVHPDDNDSGDDDPGDILYTVEASDGWIGAAWESELTEIAP